MTEQSPAKVARAEKKSEKARQKAIIAQIRGESKDRTADRVGRLVHQDFQMAGPSLFVYENEVWRGKPGAAGSVGGPIAGATAELTTQGQLTQRLSATRILALGVFALAVPKQSGNMHTLVHVSAPTFELLYSPAGKVGAAQMKQLTRYVEYINNRSRELAPNAAPIDQQPPTASLSDQLAKLAELHSAGALTDDEYATAKGHLLG